ncbi:hypothetical protein OYT88_04670 [Sporolactobacillus sp. CQH2019]|uniref:hypothetical protein n=1 Tax=Sporolactobacillus sp. CQH2019 TaxID=3023512 RepID=UPI002367A8BC|nr:hypothetical protein [Sporolactobacillus sp. CQH2019]MDD9147842.1 hypothetical protein [Sporolactobacillus sp. CQH2019]
MEKMNRVKVFIRIKDSSIEFIDRSKPVRVEAEYVGRYKKAIVCIRENDKKNGYVSFEVSTGRVISRDDDFESLKKRSFELIAENYLEMEPMIDQMAPLYGIGCFVFNDHEILGNALLEKKTYDLCLRRTNGRYKIIADKILS